MPISFLILIEVPKHPFLSLNRSSWLALLCLNVFLEHNNILRLKTSWIDSNVCSIHSYLLITLLRSSSFLLSEVGIWTLSDDVATNCNTCKIRWLIFRVV